MSGPGAPVTLAVVSGGTDVVGRVILESADRYDTVVVRVTDAQGRAVPDVAVTWTTDDSDAVVTPLATASDAEGLVRAEWRLSGAPGTWKARAITGALAAAEASFTVTSWSVKHVAAVGPYTCVQSHDDKLWCRESDTAPFTTRLGGGTIRALDGSKGIWPADRQVCVITTPGTIQCAVTGAPTLEFTTVPGQTVPFAKLALLAGGRTHCALDSTGGVWCWGSRQGGMLGDGTTGEGFRVEVAPVDVPNGVRFIALALGGGNSCALADDGIPWCWGQTQYGVAVPAKGPTVTSPRAVEVPVPLVDVTISGFGGTACGITADRRVVCWGENLGYGGSALDGSPTLVTTAGDAVVLRPMPSGFIALRSNGALAGWGHFQYGHIGGPGKPGPFARGTSIRARAVYRGLDLLGRTCIDDGSGAGTVCTLTQDIVATVHSNPTVLWTGFVKPAGAN